MVAARRRGAQPRGARPRARAAVCGRPCARPRLRTGDLVRHLGDVRYVGVDVSEAYIESARRHYGDNAEFRLGDATRVDDDLRGFDLVLAFGVVHHLDDDGARRLFAGAAQALEPTGRMVAVDPAFAEGQSGAARWVISRDRGSNVRTAEAYARLAEGSPARRDGADPQRPAPHPVHALRARGAGAVTVRARYGVATAIALGPLLAVVVLRLPLLNQLDWADAWFYSAYAWVPKHHFGVFGWNYFSVRFPAILSIGVFERVFGTDAGYLVLRYLLAVGTGTALYLCVRRFASAWISVATTMLLYLDPFFSRMLLWDYSGFAAVSAGVAGFALWWWSDGRRLGWTLLPGAALAIALFANALIGTALAVLFVVEAVACPAAGPANRGQNRCAIRAARRGGSPRARARLRGLRGDHRLLLAERSDPPDGRVHPLEQRELRALPAAGLRLDPPRAADLAAGRALVRADRGPGPAGAGNRPARPDRAAVHRLHGAALGLPLHGHLVGDRNLVGIRLRRGRDGAGARRAALERRRARPREQGRRRRSPRARRPDGDPDPERLGACSSTPTAGWRGIRPRSSPC